MLILLCLFKHTAPEDREKLVHPTRVINFLVGTRGKNETMSIGGPWSPSLDGPNPDSDPSVLVRTAIRTCKALTGIDLSGCTQWHKFLEIHYRRQETTSKPARTETTVILLPDVWSIMPTKSEFADLEKRYAEGLKRKINPEEYVRKPRVVPEKEVAKEGKKESAPTEKEEKKEEEAAAEEEEKEVEVEEKKTEEVKDSAEANEEKKEEGTVSNETEEEKKDGEEEAMDTSEGAEEEKEENKEEKTGPTHWKELDVKAMKVNELREELDARKISSKGLKSQLVGRLQKAVKEEQEKEIVAAAEKEKIDEEKEKKEVEEEEAAVEKKKEEKKEEAMVVEEKKSGDEEPEVVAIVKQDSKKKSDDSVFVKPKALDDKQKSKITSAYKFPSGGSLGSTILVHPNSKAKSGKFDCTTMSLSVLLDYRTDDNKEGTFEVSLFAELFNEMMMRDSGFQLYKALENAPSKEEKKDKREKEKGGDKDKANKEDEVKDKKEGKNMGFCF